MSTFSTSKGTDWNFRIFATRTIKVKSRNDDMRKAVAIDLLVDLPFAFLISDNVSIESVEVEKNFSATFNVYTSKKIGEVKSGFVEFFEVLDVDQSFEDFVKAYWMYPNLIAFELTEIEPP
jgi:hypothetical protein